MREVKLNRSQYGVLFGALANTPSANEEEMEVSVRLMRKVKAKGEPVDGGEAQRRAEAEGHIYFPAYRVTGDVSLMIEEDEHRTLAAKLKKYLPQITGQGAEMYLELIHTVRDAEQVPAPGT